MDLNIRNIPPELIALLKVEAAKRHLTLREYCMDALRRQVFKDELRFVREPSVMFEGATQVMVTNPTKSEPEPKQLTYVKDEYSQ